MDKATLKALKGSITKWEKIVDGKEVDKGVDNCPLCQLFLIPLNKRSVWISDEEACVGCPVRNKTGQPYCEDSPYKDYSKAKWTGHTCLLDEYARRELKFLKSLLPKKKGKKNEKPTRSKSEQRRVPQRQKRVAVKRSKNR